MTYNEYAFVQVYLKKDVADRLNQICKDAKNERIFISKSDLLRVMLNNATIIEYAVKHIIYDKSGTLNFPSQPKRLNTIPQTTTESSP